MNPIYKIFMSSRSIFPLMTQTLDMIFFQVSSYLHYSCVVRDHEFDGGNIGILHIFRRNHPVGPLEYIVISFGECNKEHWQRPWDHF